MYIEREDGILAALKDIDKDAAKKTLLIGIQSSSNVVPYITQSSSYILVDCTTLEQAVAKDVSATIFKDVGAYMIDAPVSGGASVLPL